MNTVSSFRVEDKLIAGPLASHSLYEMILPSSTWQEGGGARGNGTASLPDFSLVHTMRALLFAFVELELHSSRHVGNRGNACFAGCLTLQSHPKEISLPAATHVLHKYPFISHSQALSPHSSYFIFHVHKTDVPHTMSQREMQRR